MPQQTVRSNTVERRFPDLAQIFGPANLHPRIVGILSKPRGQCDPEPAIRTLADELIQLRLNSHTILRRAAPDLLIPSRKQLPRAAGRGGDQVGICVDADGIIST